MNELPPEEPEFSGTEPVQTAPRRPTAKTALALGIVVALIAGGTVFALRASNTGPSDLAARVPADTVVYAEVSLRPEGDQRAALDALLDRLPADRRDDVGEFLDARLQELFAELDLDWSGDVKDWIGTSLAVTIPEVDPSVFLTGPKVVALVPVRNEDAARASLQRAIDAAGGGGAFEIVDGVAYLAERADTVSGFLAEMEGATPLSEDAEYRAERDRYGNVLAFAWFDGEDLEALLGGVAAGTGQQIPATGRFAMAVRATDVGIVAEGTASGGEAAPGASGGSPSLLESTPAELIGALTFFDLGTGIEGALQGLFGFPGVPLGPEIDAFFAPFDVLGLDLETDIAPWMKGEISIIVGGFTGGFIPDVGVVVESTDDAALDRTLRALRNRIGRLGDLIGAPLDVQPSGDGFVIGVAEGFGVYVRRGPDRVVFTGSPTYADTLLQQAPDALGQDAVYRRAVGPSADGVAFQLYVRTEPIRQVIGSFISFAGSEARAEYERTAEPFLELFEAIAVRATSDGAGGGTFRVALTVAED